ncbi:protein PML-like [Saccostrea cucullata]|uniref:protein PML-like n=1 Tax=Saccostrea cuccullata TaxID=36930 RepID=UPI002ED6878B
MYHHGTPVKSEDLYTAMLDFVDYLYKKQKPILFGHNIAAYDVPVLLKKLQETHLLPEFLKQIAGCIDTLKLSRRQFDKNVIGNYKQQNLVSKILGEDYDAHDASADVKSLYKLLGKLDFSEKDIFPFNVSVLTESLTPLIRASSITKPTARRLAQCGLCQRHLQLAFNRGGETGLNFVLKEHGFKARTAKAITRFFSSKEE